MHACNKPLRDTFQVPRPRDICHVYKRYADLAINGDLLTDNILSILCLLLCNGRIYEQQRMWLRTTFFFFLLTVMSIHEWVINHLYIFLIRYLVSNNTQPSTKYLCCYNPYTTAVKYDHAWGGFAQNSTIIWPANMVVDTDINVA